MKYRLSLAQCFSDIVGLISLVTGPALSISGDVVFLTLLPTFIKSLHSPPKAALSPILCRDVLLGLHSVLALHPTYATTLYSLTSLVCPRVLCIPSLASILPLLPVYPPIIRVCGCIVLQVLPEFTFSQTLDRSRFRRGR